ncbi:endo alpha-1,4 polygalactosaminidase [Herbiconiux moechotypicola]|uniref:Endo alpha-1,4 polygalactosaminidase n=1 Tax=Herbiconiux moechotypicola TaxID=637393 RepID=A0ABN3E071_9MICO|nr:endo alpha-1,4 polygalactosaminidase [Herbiconiux moechotypicola]MCS5731098.1 endo alpha-1,4 polygalactosaminidase [Herbiconiux moechotypicola]
MRTATKTATAGLAVLVLAAALTGCAGERGEVGDGEPVATGTSSASATAEPTVPATKTPRGVVIGGVTPLPTGERFDYQLGGGYPPADGVGIVARDSTDVPEAGLYSICYVNGFQTQPGADWPEELVLHDDSGDEVFDPGWPDERILDISSEANRQAIAAIQAETIRGCAEAGFSAVEFDNLDSYTRSGGALDLDSAVAFARLLVDQAHVSGLAAGQKNTPELGERGASEIGFDFAVSEQCALYDECAAYTDVYGDRVLDIEYVEDLDGDFAEVCADPATPPHAILRDRDLAPAGAEGHVYESC